MRPYFMVDCGTDAVGFTRLTDAKRAANEVPDVVIYRIAGDDRRIVFQKGEVWFPLLSCDA